MDNSPLIRPYFLGGSFGGVPYIPMNIRWVCCLLGGFVIFTTFAMRSNTIEGSGSVFFFRKKSVWGMAGSTFSPRIAKKKIKVPKDWTNKLIS